MKKAAIELSVSFLVTIIIGLVLFGLGIGFIYTLVGQAQDFFELTQDDIDARIEDLRCRSTDLVCVPRSTIEVSSDRPGFSGVRITNVDDLARTFDILVEETGFTPRDGVFVEVGEPQYPVDAIDIRFERGERRVEATQTESHGILFIASDGAPIGDYLMKVRVIDQDTLQPYATKTITVAVR